MYPTRSIDTMYIPPQEGLCILHYYVLILFGGWARNVEFSTYAQQSMKKKTPPQGRHPTGDELRHAIAQAWVGNPLKGSPHRLING